MFEMDEFTLTSEFVSTTVFGNGDNSSAGVIDLVEYLTTFFWLLPLRGVRLTQNGKLTSMTWTHYHHLPLEPGEVVELPTCSSRIQQPVCGENQCLLTFQPRRGRRVPIVEYLTTYLGQKYRSTATAASLSVVYCLVLMTGVVGNVTTCIVIARNGYMHTATNYYLFSLAISDMLSLVLGMYQPATKFRLGPYLICPNRFRFQSQNRFRFAFANVVDGLVLARLPWQW